MDGDALADIEDFCKFLQTVRGAIPGTAEGPVQGALPTSDTIHTVLRNSYLAPVLLGTFPA